MADDPDGLGLDWPRRRVRNGRWTALDDTITQKVLNSLRAGSTIFDACQYAGIDRATHYEWRRRGEEYHERLSDTPPNEMVEDEWEERYRQYFLATNRARAESRVRANVTISSVMETGTPSARLRAAIFVLERQDPDHWARRVELTGAGGGPLDVREVTEADESIVSRLRSRQQQRALDVQSREVKSIEYDPWAPFTDPDDAPAEIVWPEDPALG
jgi:hypothetical protein